MNEVKTTYRVELAGHLRIDLCQWAYLLVASDKTEWVNEKPEGAAA